MAFCENCGTRLGDGAQFCPACGKRVSLNGQQQTQSKEPAMHDVPAPSAPGETVIGSWEMKEAATQPAQGAAAGTPAPAPTAARGPSTRYSSSGGGAVPRTPKKKSKASRIVGAVAALAVIAVLALYVVPLFVPHPVDPNEHQVYTPPTASEQANTAATSTAASSFGEADASSSYASDGEKSNAAASAASSTSAGTSSSASDGEKSNAAASAASSSSAGTSGSAPAASSSDSPKATVPSSGFSTSEWPTLAEFTWLTGEAAKGNVPTGATRLTDLGAVTGGWKAYLYDSDMEWLLHVTIDVGQSDVIAELDWYYLRDGATGQSREDTTPTSFFSGAWDAGVLDAVGSGRVTLATFWQQDGHQYAIGSLMWPDGSVSTLALVRP